MKKVVWRDWRDIPFETYIQNENNVVPGVWVWDKRCKNDKHHIKEIGNGCLAVFNHLVEVCEAIGEGNYYITPATWKELGVFQYYDVPLKEGEI